MSDWSCVQFSGYVEIKAGKAYKLQTVQRPATPLFRIQVPLKKNPESTAWNPESNTVLDSLTWGEMVPKQNHVDMRNM